MHPDLDTLLDYMIDIEDKSYLEPLKKVVKAKSSMEEFDFSDLLNELIEFSETIEKPIPKPAKKVLSPKEKAMNLIKELNNDKEKIMSLIEKLFADGIDEDLMYLLQEKLSLYFGYDETSSIDISEDINEESILLNIIELFNSIDFKANTLSDKLKINMLKSLINEYKILKKA